MNKRYFILSAIIFSFVFVLESSAQVKSPFSVYDFYRSNKKLDSIVESNFQLMTDTQRVAQMIIQACGGLGKSKAEIGSLVKNSIIGGTIFLKSEKSQVEEYIAYFDSIRKANKLFPLMFTTDGEPSLINNKIKGIKQFPKTNTLTTVEQNVNTGKDIAKILLGFGITYNFAPVCDLAINKEIINSRSYGSDKGLVIANSKAFIRASQEAGLASTAKHFPGHGNVKGDTHVNLVSIDGDMIEVDIYKDLIADSVISVMVGHIAIKNNPRYNTNGEPSSCSKLIVTGLLRTELNFNGIIVTDGMNMGALGKMQDPCLKAVEAGCDVILIPANERKLSSQILSKLSKDKEFKQQVYNSVKRIIRLKACLGLI
jgi:beta-N-acetylhexosaminidase